MGSTSATQQELTDSEIAHLTGPCIVCGARVLVPEDLVGPYCHWRCQP